MKTGIRENEDNFNWLDLIRCMVTKLKHKITKIRKIEMLTKCLTEYQVK